MTSLPPGWVMGLAARTGVEFEQLGRRRMFCRGCFATVNDREVVLSINHGCLTRRPWPDEPIVDRALVMATTQDKSLLLQEDEAGLFFLAYIRPDACIQTGDGPVLNIHDAIANGLCLGASIAPHGGRGYPREDNLLSWASVNVIEVSILLPPETAAGCPGTWVRPATPDALAERGVTILGAGV